MKPNIAPLNRGNSVRLAYRQWEKAFIRAQRLGTQREKCIYIVHMCVRVFVCGGRGRWSDATKQQN